MCVEPHTRRQEDYGRECGWLGGCVGAWVCASCVKEGDHATAAEAESTIGVHSLRPENIIDMVVADVAFRH